MIELSLSQTIYLLQNTKLLKWIKICIPKKRRKCIVFLRWKKLLKIASVVKKIFSKHESTYIDNIVSLDILEAIEFRDDILLKQQTANKNDFPESFYDTIC